MKKLIIKSSLLSLKRYLVSKASLLISFFEKKYKVLNKQQRIVFFSGFFLIVLLIIIFDVSHPANKTEKNSSYSVNFEKRPAKPKSYALSSMGIKQNTDQRQLQVQLDQLKTSSMEQMQALQAQLQSVQSSMSSLASQQDVQQLQQTVSKPNHTLLGKVDRLQDSMKQIVEQTAKKMWVDPSEVQKYFRLVAVQGFSDGMRTIIDVDGNQTTLSSNEICPACRGWTLQSMDFANQSAVFSKQANGQTLYVKLQAN